MEAGLKPYNSINSYLKSTFGEKVVKLSLEGGFTCPNRDGSKGFGGCSFCSSTGSGEMASDIESQIDLLRDKWPKVKKFIAYFQSYTSTYAPVSVLRDRFEAALSQTDICGLAVATRPDCLPDDILDLLDEMNKKTFMWVELGLQTTNEETARKINRCYPLADYGRAVRELKKRGIRYVTHLILGLPDETEEDMFSSLRYVCKDHPFGIKLHLMNLVKTSPLYKERPDFCSFEDLDDYVDLVIRLLRIVPPEVTIHRLTGDVPRPILVSPAWSYQKRTILNRITSRMAHAGIKQGDQL